LFSRAEDKLKLSDDEIEEAFTKRGQSVKLLFSEVLPISCPAGTHRLLREVCQKTRAAELSPVDKDALDGSAIVRYLAMIAAWVGDKDLACEQLATAVRIPSGLTYGQLKLMPFWDPLRGDPRFEKIVEEAKEPVALK
jgi:hypothetical protein